MIHIYWHTEPPPGVHAAIEAWRTLGKDVWMWTPDDLPDLHQTIGASNHDVDAIDRVRHGANVVRWHVLAEHGGVWADADVTPLRPFDPPAVPWSAGFGRLPTPFLCGGPAGHDLWHRALAASLDHPTGISPEASGGRMLGRVKRPGELRVLPAGLFTAFDAAGRPLPEPTGGRYSTHEWATSRLRHR